MWNILTGERLGPPPPPLSAMPLWAFIAGTLTSLTSSNIPIYGDGLKDVVVVECPDGILVCSKEHSEEIKKAVKSLILRSMYEERRWGICRVLEIVSMLMVITLLPRVLLSTLEKMSFTRFITIVLRFGLLWKERASLCLMVLSKELKQEMQLLFQ